MESSEHTRDQEIQTPLSASLKRKSGTRLNPCPNGKIPGKIFLFTLRLDTNNYSIVQLCPNVSGFLLFQDFYGPSRSAQSTCGRIWNSVLGIIYSLRFWNYLHGRTIGTFDRVCH